METALQNEGKKVLKLDDRDLYEIEAYKGIKNDPYYKHYLHTHLALFSETFNDVKSSMPHFIRGTKPGDGIRYEDIKKMREKEEKELSMVKEKNETLENTENRFFLQSTVRNRKINSNAAAFYGFGKRKKAKAYAKITKGNGRFTVNGLPIIKYFRNVMIRHKAILPITLTESGATHNFELKIQGSGVSSQADAAIPALARALIKINPSWEDIFAKNLFLRNDPRNVEPKKPGRVKARKGYVYNRR